MYTHAYIHTHTYIHTYIHTCTHTYTHVYIHTYIHTYMYTYIHTYTHKLISSSSFHRLDMTLAVAEALNPSKQNQTTYLYTHTHIRVYTYMHTCIHTYTHTCTYTYIHVHTPTYMYTHPYTHTLTYVRAHTHDIDPGLGVYLRVPPSRPGSGGGINRSWIQEVDHSAGNDPVSNLDLATV